jgi:type IV secretory pathway VirB2 component (pilin)
MKKIENKKVTKKSLSHYCRAALLSLFVMLTIPSISSGVFGSGDAKAACIEKSGYIGASFFFTDKMAQHSSFCFSGDYTTPGDCTDSFLISGTDLCVSDTSTCVAVNSPQVRITCSQLNSAQCSSAIGDINTHCRWVPEDVNNNKLVDAVCRVYQIATGTAGKAFAAVGVISVGIGFFTGKVSWGLMISVAAGIAVFFGAPSIIGVISGSDASNLCSNVAKN